MFLMLKKNKDKNNTPKLGNKRFKLKYKNCSTLIAIK